MTIVESIWRRVIGVTILLLLGLSAQAQGTYEIQITENGAAVSGVRIIGNHRVNDLPGGFTDSNGSWRINTADTLSPNPSVAFSLPSAGYRFDPPELTLSTSTCPGRICIVEAIRDSKPTAIIHWTVINPNGSPLRDFQVAAPAGVNHCPKWTDADGYVFFVVRKQSTTCNDGDSTLDNNFFRIFPKEPVNQTCTFSNLLQTKHRVCSNGGDYTGYSLATCQSASNHPGTVGIRVLDHDTGNPMVGVQVTGTEGIKSLSNPQTDSGGRYRVTLSNFGLPSNGSITIVPISGLYQFEPSTLTISVGSCPNDECKIYASRNGDTQSANIISVTESGAAVQGANIVMSHAQLCGEALSLTSDKNGDVVFPSKKITSCSDLNSDTRDDPLSFNPTLDGCRFAHNSGTPFQMCPSTLINSTQFIASCTVPEARVYSISGRVTDLLGLPVPQAAVLNSGNQIATTDTGGRYTLSMTQGASAALSVSASPMQFDPGSLGLAHISQDFTSVDFGAVAPDSNIGGVPVEPSPCPFKPYYGISGYVYDAVGQPVENAQVYNNHGGMVFTDANGQYTLSAEAQSSSWISVEYGDWYFTPSAFAVPFISCDQEAIDFQQSGAATYRISGQVVDAQYQPIVSQEVSFLSEDGERTTSTDSDGLFSFMVPEYEDYQVQVASSETSFAPSEHVGSAVANRSDLIFQAIPATPTPTFSATPINTPIATSTHTPGSGPGSPAPTSTPVSPQPSPIGSAAPTSTPIFTATLPPSGTAPSTLVPPTHTPTGPISGSPTPTRTATPVITVLPNPTSPGNTPTASVPTPNPSVSPQPTSSIEVPTIVPTQKFDFTPPSREPSATATSTSTATPTPSPTPTNFEDPSSLVRLRAICSPDPSFFYYWKVENAGNISARVKWEIYGTGIYTSLEVGPNASVTFYTLSMGGTVAVRLFDETMKQIDVKAANRTFCSPPTPTVTPTPSNTPAGGATPAPTSIPGSTATPVGGQPDTNPPGSVTFTPTATATATPTPFGTHQPRIPTGTPTPGASPTSIPVASSTPTFTPTATPIPLVSVRGDLRGRNGRTLSARERSMLRKVDKIKVVVRQLDGAGQQLLQQVTDPFNYEFALTEGMYSVSLTSADGSLRVTSKPAKYKIWITKQMKEVTVPFAIQVGGR